MVRVHIAENVYTNWQEVIWLHGQISQMMQKDIIGVSSWLHASVARTARDVPDTLSCYHPKSRPGLSAISLLMTCSSARALAVTGHDYAMTNVSAPARDLTDAKPSGSTSAGLMTLRSLLRTRHGMISRSTGNCFMPEFAPDPQLTRASSTTRMMTARTCPSRPSPACHQSPAHLAQRLEHQVDRPHWV